MDYFCSHRQRILYPPFTSLSVLSPPLPHPFNPHPPPILSPILLPKPVYPSHKAQARAEGLSSSMASLCQSVKASVVSSWGLVEAQDQLCSLELHSSESTEQERARARASYAELSVTETEWRRKESMLGGHDPSHSPVLGAHGSRDVFDKVTFRHTAARSPTRSHIVFSLIPFTSSRIHLLTRPHMHTLSDVVTQPTSNPPSVL